MIREGHHNSPGVVDASASMSQDFADGSVAAANDIVIGVADALGLMRVTGSTQGDPQHVLRICS
jgi:hypothetical protein